MTPCIVLAQATTSTNPNDSIPPPLSGGIVLNGSAILIAGSAAAAAIAQIWRQWTDHQRRQAQRLDATDAQQDGLLLALVGDQRAERKVLFDRLLKGADQTSEDVAELRIMLKALQQQQAETQRIVTSLAILLRQQNAD